MTRRSIGRFGALAVATLAAGALVAAQTRRPASPAGSAATEVSGHFVQGQEGPVYQGGKWIEMTFGRPIKRGRDLFGSGATYGKDLNGGAPVWRAGANFTTRLKTEVPLVIAGKTVPRRRIQRVRRSEGAEGLDLHRVQLAGADQVRPEQQGRALGLVRLHAGQGRRPRADDDRDARPCRSTSSRGSSWT